MDQDSDFVAIAGEAPRALKSRSMATLAAMAETVVRVGGMGD